jgi:hypothetical protein
MQGQAWGSGDDDNTYGGHFTANDGLQNTGILATADGDHATAIRGIAYGTSSSIAGQFDGHVNITGILTHPSDGKFKKNIRNIDSALGKVKNLRPVMYEMKTDEYKGRVILAEGSQYGVIADEAKAILPHLVRNVSILPIVTAEDIKNKVKKERVEYASVDYLGFIPLLLKAIQEQQAQIEAMRIEIARLKE